MLTRRSGDLMSRVVLFNVDMVIFHVFPRVWTVVNRAGLSDNSDIQNKGTGNDWVSKEWAKNISGAYL